MSTVSLIAVTVVGCAIFFFMSIPWRRKNSSAGSDLDFDFLDILAPGHRGQPQETDRTVATDSSGWNGWLGGDGDAGGGD